MRFTWSGYLLGFALGGFFDGILLHQILQWHHLLVGVEGEAFSSMRVQVLADGLFHLLMYLIAIVGLTMLWRSRDRIVWADPTGAVWAIKVAEAGDARTLYSHGALLVTASPAVLGCLAWTRS
jgi:uncharacterized membrane protein